MKKLTLEEEYELLESYFSSIDDEALAGMAGIYIKELFEMCMLLSLDYQLEIESHVQIN